MCACGLIYALLACPALPDDPEKRDRPPSPVVLLEESRTFRLRIGMRLHATDGAIQRAVIVKAGEPQTHFRRTFDVSSQLNPQFIHAADSVAANVETAGPQPLLGLPQNNACTYHRGRGRYDPDQFRLVRVASIVLRQQANA